MREIIFRGKRIDNGEWVYGSLFVGFKKCYICPEAIAMYNFDGALCLGGFVEVDPTTVGQYTGLKDKNGEMIFEGDIIKWDSREWGCDHLDIVNWNYELFNIRRTDWKEWCEVISNIQDNPELIKEEQP